MISALRRPYAAVAKVAQFMRISGSKKYIKSNLLVQTINQLDLIVLLDFIGVIFPSAEPAVMTFSIPNPVYKPRFEITRASHVVHYVRDLAASKAFYVDLLGLIVSDETASTLWLRGLEEGCHHSLVLKTGEPGCARVGMRVLTEEDLDLAEQHFRSKGFPTAFVEVEHQGRTLHTIDPAGTRLEFCATMETRPRLFHHVEAYRGASLQRLDHVQILTPKVQESLEFYTEMGFRLSEYVVHQGGEDLMMVFLQRKGNPHDIVFTDSPGPRIHHLAYTVPDTQYLMTAADHFVRAGLADNVEFGPARHFSPGLARFLYVRDPDGHRVEMFPTHYQTIDIEDEPLRWEVPNFLIGGWQTPPKRWLEEATEFKD
jgi:catechol 2,3-dioxygenase